MAEPVSRPSFARMGKWAGQARGVSLPKRAGFPVRRQGGAIVAKDVVLAPVKVSGTVRGGIPTFRGKPCAGG